MGEAGVGMSADTARMRYLSGESRGDVAHALVRAASALVPTPALSLSACLQGVETSLDTARTSACATPLLDCWTDALRL